MIDQLTTEQELLLDTYRDKWINIGMSTEQTNPQKAMAALGDAYKAANLTCPDKYELYDSPTEAILEMKLRYDLDIKVCDFSYGNQSAPWLSFIDYAHEVLKIDQHTPLAGLIEFSRHSGWALFFDELVVLTHPPMEIKLDDQRRAHSDTDYAIKYRDGTGITVWHGCRIPSDWIFDKTTVTPEVILNWPNIEERRCSCEIIGWANAINLMNAEIVDEDENKEIGTLLQVHIPNIGDELFLTALDPNTNTLVGLPVPPNMKTALEANSWTYGIDAIDFSPYYRV